MSFYDTQCLFNTLEDSEEEQTRLDGYWHQQILNVVVHKMTNRF